MGRHGRAWFIGAIFIMSVATYVLAVYIGSFLSFLAFLAVYIGNVFDFFKYPSPPGGRGKKPRSENPPNLWKWLCPVDQNKASQPTLGGPKDKDQGSQNEQKSMEEGKANGTLVEARSIDDPTSKRPENP
jgi:hypothetical protein